MMTRRDFLVRTGSGIIALSGLEYASPLSALSVQGQSQDPLQILSQNEADIYNAWCDILAIGAAKMNVAQFLDKYLNRPFGESLLMLRFFASMKLDEFYLAGIAGIDQESKAQFSKPFLELTEPQREFIIESASTSSTIAWKDPAPAFFYFISRNDAIDVVYGTVKGFEKLKIPYLPHIRPLSPW